MSSRRGNARRWFGRFLLGSVSQWPLEQTPCDLFLFRGQATVERPLNMVVVLDGSEHADRPLDVAKPLAAALSVCLLVHVIDGRIPFAAIELPGGREALREQGAKLLREARERVVAPVEAVVEDLRDGSARPGLIAAGEEHAPAIAVAGSRGARLSRPARRHDGARPRQPRLRSGARGPRSPRGTVSRFLRGRER